MTRTDRLTGIILALQNGRQTAAQLAARFEVSRRTILRDVDALGQIGVPVISIPRAGSPTLAAAHLRSWTSTAALAAVRAHGRL